MHVHAVVINITLGLSHLSAPAAFCRYYKVGQVPSPAAIGNVQNVMGVLFSGANFLGNINLM